MRTHTADWLRRVHHDLVKRALWAVRDLREAGRSPGPADDVALRAGLRDLVDGEGRSVGAVQLWLHFRTEAEAAGFAPPAAVLDAFEETLDAAERATTAAPASAATRGRLVDALHGLATAYARLEDACRASS